MLFEKKIVKILNDYNIYKGMINRDDFVDYVIIKKWSRLSYCKGGPLRRRLEIAIDDCVGYEFIEEDKKSKNIKVTRKGRDYLKFLGFIEEFFKRRKRTIVNTVVFLLGAISTYLIDLFLSK